MTTPLLFRFLGLSTLVIAFCLMTVMAHRTKVHAQLTRMIGLGIACALITCAWWINTSTFQTLNFASQSLSSLLFFVIGIIYSGAVMHSQSAVRWAGAFAACLLVIVGFVLDTLYHAQTTDVAIAFAIDLLSVNFLGHLLRARVNQALLRSPQKTSLADVSFEALSRLMKKFPQLSQEEDFVSCLKSIDCSSHQAKVFLNDVLALKNCTVKVHFDNTIPAQALLNLSGLYREVLHQVKGLEVSTFSLTKKQSSLHLTLIASNRIALTHEDLSPLFHLQADCIQTHVDEKEIRILLGMRF